MSRAIWYYLYKILKTWKKHPWRSATFVLLLLLFCSSYISDNNTKIQEHTTVFSCFVNIFFPSIFESSWWYRNKPRHKQNFKDVLSVIARTSIAWQHLTSKKYIYWIQTTDLICVVRKQAYFNSSLPRDYKSISIFYENISFRTD